MTLFDHLEELRKRIFVILGAWFVTASIAFVFREFLLEWFKGPLPANTTLNFRGMLEPFMASMSIAAFGGVVLAAPIIFWQLWAFIAPGLHEDEKKYAVPFIAGTAVTFTLGVLFARYVALPFAVPFLVGFLGDAAEAELMIGNYVSTMVLYMSVLGIIFEMPVVGFLLARLGIINHEMLTKYRRYAIVIGLCIAAVITPTADPINLGLIAIPLVLLYELTIFVVRFAQRRVPISDEHVSS